MYTICVVCVALDKLIIYVLRRLHLVVKVQKYIINQYFNVYALRRVRTAGYATGFRDGLLPIKN